MGGGLGVVIHMLTATTIAVMHIGISPSTKAAISSTRLINAKRLAQKRPRDV